MFFDLIESGAGRAAPARLCGRVSHSQGVPAWCRPGAGRAAGAAARATCRSAVHAATRPPEPAPQCLCQSNRICALCPRGGRALQRRLHVRSGGHAIYRAATPWRAQHSPAQPGSARPRGSTQIMSRGGAKCSQSGSHQHRIRTASTATPLVQPDSGAIYRPLQWGRGQGGPGRARDTLTHCHTLQTYSFIK